MNATTNQNPSPEYIKALDDSRIASAIFRAVQAKYRANIIGDEAYLEARNIFQLSQLQFDQAYKKEQGEL